MKVSKKLSDWLNKEHREMGVSYADLGRLGGTNWQNFQRVMNGQVSEIFDDTKSAICKAFDLTARELEYINEEGCYPDPDVLDKMTLASDPPGPEYSADVWDDLATWGRKPSTSQKAKAAVLSTAELGGFDSPRLSGALSVLSTASSQEEDDLAERQPAVA